MEELDAINFYISFKFFVVAETIEKENINKTKIDFQASVLKLIFSLEFHLSLNLFNLFTIFPHN